MMTVLLKKVRERFHGGVLYLYLSVVTSLTTHLRPVHTTNPDMFETAYFLTWIRVDRT